MEDHIKYMRLCLQLAEQGRGDVAPNPMVGCVIVENDQVIAEGYHMKYGGPHAEVNAINNLPADYDLSGVTLYVNLEPCSHYGKTPPCSDLIISRKPKRVVVCNPDPNPLVAGKGLEKLRNAGIEVLSGILEEEGNLLNKRFFTFHRKKRPYIILKWAETRDGFISKLPLPVDKTQNWITSQESKKLVHLWRSQEQGILIGTNTAIADDPELTTRLVSGNDPIRIVIDRELRIPASSKLFGARGKCVVYTEKKKEDRDNICYRNISFDENFLLHLMHDLHALNIQSVIIEGGTTTLSNFISKDIWDEARIFVGNKTFEDGIKAPPFDLFNAKVQIISNDKLYLVERH